MASDLFKRKPPPEEEVEKKDSFAYKYTICERCQHPECSDKGRRNLFHGFDEESCVQFTIDGKPRPLRTRNHRESDEVEYSTHHDPNKRNKVGTI